MATFERIIEHAPASFSAAQMRVFLRLFIHHGAYSFLEEVASLFCERRRERAAESEEEIVLAALDNTADEKLTGFALRLVLSDHIGIPREGQPDLLSEAEQAFVPKKPKAVKAKQSSSPEGKAVTGKPEKKQTPKKRAA